MKNSSKNYITFIVEKENALGYPVGYISGMLVNKEQLEVYNTTEGIEVVKIENEDEYLNKYLKQKINKKKK